MKIILMIFVLLLSDVILVQGSDEDILNVCRDSYNAKPTPGPEAKLYPQCSSWENRSCCTGNFSYDFAFDNMGNRYNFTHNHCSIKKNISSQCLKMFQTSWCFYECSPNLGPWIAPPNHRYDEAQIRKVPICESDCNKWWEACKNDYTCLDNWIDGRWNISSGTLVCPSNSECQTYQKIFTNATNFCQSIPSNSYKVVPDDSARCMTFEFTGENPNDKVARYYAEKLELPSGCVDHRVSILFVAVVTMTSYLWNR